MDTRNIISGVCADPRIGNYYNNPSFGFGGYCLPKDTMQLSTLMRGSKSNVGSVVDGVILSNKIRRFTCINEMMRMVQTLGKSPLHTTIGIYRLNGLHNSVMRKVIDSIHKFTSNVVIYEPRISDKTYDGCDVYEDLDAFKLKCDIIMADRVDKELSDVIDKVYTTDLVGNLYMKAADDGK
jgi:UDPglucose 6-dehydrogenase